MSRFLVDYPELMKDWDYEKNSELDPSAISYGSNKYAWWKCSICGESWQSKIANRTILNRGCPKCAHKVIAEKHRIASAKKNNLAKKFPELAAEWHPTKNGDLRPENLSCSNDLIVWWKCPVCGSDFKMAIKHRTGRGGGCPVCNKKGTSFPEQALYYYISQIYPDAENRFTLDGVELDIYVPSQKIAVEYDGGRWHSNLKKDNKKDKFCFTNNIKLFRIRDASLPRTEYAECIPCEDNKESLELAIKELFSKLYDNCPTDINILSDEQVIRALLKRYLHDNSLAIKYPLIASEFAEDLNHGITANNVSWSTSAQYWWRCKECGHIWKASPNKRTRAQQGTGCPKCAINKTGKKNQTKVINLDTGQVFESVAAAAASCGGTKGEITSHCRGKRSLTYGYHWAYYDADKPRRGDYKGKVINLDTQIVYDTPNDAAKFCNGDRRNIVQCCYGKTKTAYGYHWMFYKSSEDL